MPGALQVVGSLAALALSVLCMSLHSTSTPVSLSTVALTSAVLPAIMLGKLFSPIRYYLRLTSFLLGIAACSGSGIVISIAMSLVGRSKDINYVVARCFHGLVAPLCGFRFKVEGEEHLDNNKPAIVLGNHQTMIDILYLGRIFPKGCSIMAKKEIQWFPLLGQWMTLSNAVFVNRSNRESAVAMMAKVATTMRAKLLSLFIFPEGTRSASQVPSMLPFKKGPFHLAVAAQLPIVPIVCENYAHAYSAQRRKFDGGDVVIRVLPPISTEGLTSSSEDINALVEKTRAAMLEAIEELGRNRKEQLRLEGVFNEGEQTVEEEENTPLVEAQH